jgi:phenylalanyl-tRNA synthetase beta chain
MKVTLNWLRNHVDFAGTPEELTERLTLLGLEVEGVERLAGQFDGVVVAQVLSRDKHPNADKLSVCRVADGQGERQIVCGAQNFKAGDKVPLILPGASLPPKAGETQPFTIKVGKIRSVESHGMMCSHEELGIEPEAFGLRREDGLLILPETATVGQPLAVHLGLSGSDVVFDLEVTPNRPDLNSVIGIAREVAAVTGKPLRLPLVTLPEVPAGVAAPAVVRLEAPDLCPRYTALVIRGLKVGPSPAWLRSALEKVGLRSINNVVDISNFVMLETGQPLHTFDLRRLRTNAAGLPEVVIRRASEGETFTTLDGREHTLNPENLLIADAAGGIALAGVMGGLDSGIQADTTDVLIESAYFTPTGIRRTSKALALRTDASYRFERGADVQAAASAGRRCAQLLLELAGGSLSGQAIDVFPNPPQAKELTLRQDRAKVLLGVDIPSGTQAGFLAGLGLEEVGQGSRDGGATSVWRVPSWRVDLKREVDLVEEVARLFGVDRIPSTAPRGAVGSHPFDATYDRFAEVRRILTGLGLDEAQGQTLISDTSARRVSEEVVLLANPLSSDMNALRPSLLPGLLDSLSHNLTRRNGDVQLFEIGRVFTLQNGAAREGWRVAIALTGARDPRFWSGADRNAKADVYDLKGLVEELIERLGLRGVAYARRPESTPLMLESAAITLGGKLPLGQLGQLLPTLAKRHDLRDAVLLAELDLDVLLARSNPARSFKPLAAFPSIQRDVAMIVPEATTHEAVLAAVKQAKPGHLEAVELFDVFRGKHVPEGHKSLAYSFTYRAADRTLKDDEVQAAHDRLVGVFQSALGATLRA